MSKSASPVTLIGIPLDLGAENLDVSRGPAAFRHQELVAKLTKAGLSLTDTGDVACPDRIGLGAGDPKMRYAETIVEVAQESARRAERAVKGGQRVIGLGGDHSMTLGLVSGVSAALAGDLGLIYFDAHGDMNTNQTSPSGNVHGMQLASLMGFGAPELAQLHTPARKIDPRNLVHIGGYDLDAGERELIAREKLAAFTIADLLRSGLAPLFAMIDELAGRVSNIYVSLDLDAIDSRFAPGAGMPNPAGLSYREITVIAGYIHDRCNVVGIDVVEYSPATDPDHRTAELGIELVGKFLGVDYSWYTNYLNRQPLNAETVAS